MNDRQVWVAAAVMLTGVFLTAYARHEEGTPHRKAFASFPQQIGEWTGTVERFDDSIYAVLGVDDSILANFTDGRGKTVNLYIGFYQSQRKGKQIHSPKNCMPGAGWNITDTSVIPLSRSSSLDDSRKAIKLILQKGDQKQLMLYWFHSQGRIVASEYLQRFYMIVDSIVRHRTDGSFVRLITPMRDGAENASLDELMGFAELLLPILNDFIPL